MHVRLENQNMEKAHGINIPYIIWKIGQKTNNSVGPHGCAIWQGATACNGAYGIMRNPFHGRGNQPNTTFLHRLVYILHNINSFPDFRLPLINKFNEVLHISHLCHSSLCINIEHLKLEPESVNKERNTCNHQRKCSGLHKPNCII